MRFESNILDANMIADERVRRMNERLWERLHSIDMDAMREDLLVIFEYDLTDRANGDGDQRCDGLVAITKEFVRVYADGNLTKSFRLDTASDFQISTGVGSVTAECLIDGEPMLICRANASMTTRYGAIMKRIDRFVKTGEYSSEFMRDLDKICEKCGRPFPPGSSICPRCVDKKGVILRLLKLAMPYKWYLLASVVLFFAITGVNLLTPYLSRVLVDNFIDTPTPETVSLISFILVVSALAGVSIVTNLLSIFRGRVLVHTGNKIIITWKIRNINLGFNSISI